MILKKTKTLERDTEKLINKVLKMGIVFNEGIKEYFNNEQKSFQRHVAKADKLESDIDYIRKDIEHNLYTDMLIPESRGDVLGLLEAVDDVADSIAEIILEFDIEKPEIPDLIAADLRKMAEYTQKTIEELVCAITGYFASSEQTGIYMDKVKFYENEIDNLEMGMKRKIFSEEVKGLATRLQLRYFIEKIADISDFAEHVCERLAISIIKRSI